MKFIDVNRWSRKAQFENFIGYDNPIFSVTVRLDVTNPVLYCKEKGVSFFTLFLFTLTDCANRIEEFRYRIVDGGVCLLDHADPSFVVLRKDERIVTKKTPYTPVFEDFYAKNRADIISARESAGDKAFGSEGLDCYYVSNLPWLDPYSFSNPYNFSDASQSSIPRFSWGKYVEKNGGYEMGFDVSVHHALADGLHVAKLIEKLNEAFSDVEEYLQRKKL